MACEAAPWELSKENVMPITRGRDVQKLNDKLSERPKGMRERSTVLEQERGAFEELISRAKDDSDDPIREWIRYINWQQASCPSDGHAALLLLERCAREFQDDPRYKNDPRYLKVWIAYADRLVSPGDIFKYLHKQRVGTGLSLFWAAWAFIAEKQRNFALADKLYNKGVEVGAVPVELMAERRRHFQRRMARHWVTLQQEQEAAGDAGAPTSRAALSQTRARSRVVNGVRSNVPVGTSATAYRDNRPVGGSVPIFVDPELQPPSSSISTRAHGQAHRFLDEENDPGAAGWKDVGREADRRKENEMSAGQWVGAPVPSQSTARHVNHQKQQTRSGASVPIFVDQEFQGQPPPHTHSGARTPQGGVLTPHNRSFEKSANTSTDKVKKPLAPRTERVCGEVEQLVKQPLKNLEATQPSTGSSQAAAAAGGGRGPTTTTTTNISTSTHKAKGLPTRRNGAAVDRTPPPPPPATTPAFLLAGSGGGGDDDDDEGSGNSTGGGGNNTGGGGAAVTSPAAPDTHPRATATATATPTATRGSSHTPRPRPTPTRTPAPTTTTTTTHRPTPQQPLDTAAATTTPTTRRIIAPHRAATNVNHDHHPNSTANANSASVSGSNNNRVVAKQSWKDDMTINTRFALADVDAMFGTPTHGCEGALDSPLMQSAPTSRSPLPGSAASGGGGGFTIFTDDSDHQHAHGSHSRTHTHARAPNAHTHTCADTHTHTDGRDGGGGGGALQGFSIFSDDEEAGPPVAAAKRPPSKPVAPSTGGLSFAICADEVAGSTQPPARHQASAGATGSGSCRAKPQGGFSVFSDAEADRSHAAPVKARTKPPSASGFGIFSDDGIAAPVKARTKPASASGFGIFSDDGIGQSNESAPVKAKAKLPSASSFGIFSDDGIGQSTAVPVKAKTKPSSASGFGIFSDNAAAAPVKARTKPPSAGGFGIFSDDAGGNGGARSSKPASGAFAVFSDMDGQQTSGGAIAPTRKKAITQDRGRSKPSSAFAIFNEDDDDHERGMGESSPSPPARALAGLKFDLSGVDDQAKGDGDEPDHLLRFGGLELSGIPEEDSANMTRSTSIRAHTTTLPTFPSDLSPVAPLSHSTRRSFSIHHDDM